MKDRNSSLPATPAAQPTDEIHAATDPSLTMKEKRRVGSPQCLNCATELAGPFCHYCGQPDRNFMRFFPALMREFLEEFIDLDSRFARTMKPLLFRPGKLTRDYLDGRRFRYTPPLRLYLFASIAFFLLAANLSSNAINIGMNVNPESGEPDIRISGAGESPGMMAPDELRKKLEDAGVTDVEGLVSTYEQGQAAADITGNNFEPFTADEITIDGEPWNRETNPVVIPFLPDFLNDWINDEVEESPEKAKRINDNPNLIIDQVFDILPGTMFVLLPVVALLFKFWYLFAKRFYIEHLIYALHNHAFIFISLIGILLLAQLQGSAWASEYTWLGTTATVLIVVVSSWIPLYLLISLRRVYQQGWLMTFSKFSLIGMSYLSLLAVLTSIVAILGFLLL